MAVRKQIDIESVENAQLTSQGSDSDLSKLRAKGPRALPQNPSASGWSAEAILKQLYKQPEILFAWLKALADATLDLAKNVDDALDDGVTDLSSEIAKILDGTYIAKKAAQDEDGNNIKSTYEKKVDSVHLTGDQTITGKKVFKGANASFGISGGTSADNNHTLDIWYTTNLHGPVYSNTIIPGNTFALGSAEHYWGEAFIDDLYLYGTISDGLHEWAMPSVSGTLALTSYVDSEIGKVLDGTYLSMRAKKDKNGDAIDETYFKIANLANDLTTNNSSKALTAAQGYVLKGYIDAINTLLDSDDTTLDELQEIVTYIKANRSLIDSITLSKVSVLDIVDSLDSTATDQPLSAKQGKVLDGKIGDLADDYIALGLCEVGDYDQSTGKISITHSSNLTSSYDSSSGKLTITY